jgi:hypothetical protein
MENVSNLKAKLDSLLPKVVSDYVDLPSKGLFYENGIDKLMVEYMTASDEQYLLSENYIKNGTGIELLAKNKIKDPEFNSTMSVDDLITGDLDAVLLFLRRFAYGEEYPVQIRDTNGKVFDTTVDLSKIAYKDVIEPTNSNLTYDFRLPLCKVDLTFKLLTYGEKKKLDQRIEKISKYKTDSPIFETQERIIAQIQTIAGESDRSFIEKFVRLMPPLDSLDLRTYILSVEPGLDYNYEFEGKFTGDFFREKITFGIDFFYPRVKI